MKKMLLNSSNVIVGIFTELTPVKVENGEWKQCSMLEKEGYLDPINRCVHQKDLVLVELETIPNDVSVGKNIYENGVFHVNPEYIVPGELRNQIIDEYTLQLMEEGVI